MTDKYAPPFGTYTPVAGVIGATAAAQIVTAFAQLTTFLNPGPGVQNNHPDFDEIPPHTRKLFIDEIAGLAAAIAAAPTV